MKTPNKFFVMMLMAFSFKLIYSQSYGSYVFQIVNPPSCGGCCSATACITNVFSCGAVQYAFLSSTSGTNIASLTTSQACTLNLCNGTYTAVVIDNSSNSCPVTCSVDVYYSVTTSLKEEKLSFQQMEIYPLPANNELNIIVPSNELINKIIIYDNLGQVIKEEELTIENHSAKINVSDLSNGIYYVTTRNSNESLRKKFIVNH